MSRKQGTAELDTLRREAHVQEAAVAQPRSEVVNTKRRGWLTPKILPVKLPLLMSSHSKPPALVLIRERNVGLFSMFFQVVRTLYLLEEQNIDRVPVALFGRGLAYFHPAGYEDRKTVWEYYFEPLVAEITERYVLSALGHRAFELLESKRKQLEHARGAIEWPQNLHLLQPLTELDRSNIGDINRMLSAVDWEWTESFSPIVDGKTADFNISPNRTADLVRRFIRPRSHILRKVAALFEQHLRGCFVIGVHVRGTDGFSAPARGVDIPFDMYFREIERKFAELRGKRCRVFLATDEQYVVSLFEERYGEKLVYYDGVRNVYGDKPFGQGPTGQVMPGYITRGCGIAVRNGADAVTDYATLCKCDFLVHNMSSLSLAARVSVPESIQV